MHRLAKHSTCASSILVPRPPFCSAKTSTDTGVLICSSTAVFCLHRHRPFVLDACIHMYTHLYMCVINQNGNILFIDSSVLCCFLFQSWRSFLIYALFFNCLHGIVWYGVGSLVVGVTVRLRESW